MDGINLEVINYCIPKFRGRFGRLQYLDRRSHIKPALQRLHCLPVRFRIIYKIATLMYSVLHRRCPQYLLELITFNDGDSGRRCLRSTTSRAAVVQRTRTQSATELSQSVVPLYGTVYLRH